MQATVQMITEISDCIQCDKCKTWHVENKTHDCGQKQIEKKKKHHERTKNN